MAEAPGRPDALTPPATRAPLDRRVLAALAGLKLLVHLPLLGRYGYFRDELYFLDCGRYLDWGYVDHAPMVGFVAKLALLLGGSLPALRIWPALAGTALVTLTVLLAWRLGGGRFAQGMAGLSVVVAPIYLGGDSILSMNAFEPLFWMGAAYLLVRFVATGSGWHWLGIGLLLGLGLLNKHSAAFFAVALAAGILLSRQRRALATPWPWAGGALAFLVFLPNLVWQARRDFPTLEDLRNVARTGKNVVLGPTDFVGQQILLLHPVVFPLWLAGLVWLLVADRGRFRVLGLTYLVFFSLLFALHAKNYYLAPIYPMLLAGGAVALERGLERWDRTRGRLLPRAALAGTVAAAGVVTAPIVLPLLPPERYVAYTGALGLGIPKTEVAHRGPLPQLFGDQFGWPELVGEVARVHRALPPSERAKAAVFAGNYGEAGAINLFGPAYGLPTAISGHQNYFFWGPRGHLGEVVIVLQDSRERLERVCASVEEAGRHFHRWGMAEENGAIWVCRGLHPAFPGLWPQLKEWN